MCLECASEADVMNYSTQSCTNLFIVHFALDDLCFLRIFKLIKTGTIPVCLYAILRFIGVKDKQFV